MERVYCILIGYVFGLFQTAYLYGRLHHIDIREYGSGANTIFLPAAGRWSAKQDKKIDVGENGFYWTSTRVGAGSAHDLLFNEGFSGHQQGHGMDGGGVIQRRNGLSVRCVKQ